MEAFVRRQYELYCKRQKKIALDEAESEYEAELSTTVMEHQKIKNKQ